MHHNNMMAPSSSNDDRLVDVLADSLSKYYGVTTTAGNNSITAPPPPTKHLLLMEQARREILRRRHQHHRRNNDDGTNDHHHQQLATTEEILQRALAQASQQQVEAIRSSSSSTSTATASNATQKPTSFSLLFSPGRGGSLLASTAGGADMTSFVTWAKIDEGDEAQKTMSEKMTLLEKVEYLDDILPDWKEFVRPFLQKCLQQQENNDNNDNNDNDNMAVRCVHLHRAWFHQTRALSSSNMNNVEYRSFQIDLVQNLVDYLVMNHHHHHHHYSNNNNNNNNTGDDDAAGEVIIMGISLEHAAHDENENDNDDKLMNICVCNCIDMFADWVDRSGAFDRGDTRIHDIGTAIWNWSVLLVVVDDDDDDDDETPCWQQQQQSSLVAVIRHDPTATWLAQWIAYLTPDQVLTLVSSVPQHGGASSSSSSSGATALYLLFHRLVTTMEKLQQQQQQQQRASITTTTITTIDLYECALFSLSAIRSILACTRVSRFPWHLLVPIDHHQQQQQQEQPQFGDEGSFMDVKMQLLDLYLQFINVTLHATQNDSGSSTSSSSRRRSAQHYAALQICTDAVDTILWGCQNTSSSRNTDDDKLYQEMMAKARSLLLHVETLKEQQQQQGYYEINLVHELLNNVLARLDRAALNE